jgi:hypothetical protein
MKTPSKKSSKKDAIIYTSFSKSGAMHLRKVMKEKYGCTIVEEPKFDEKRGLWIMKLIDPNLVF